MAQSNTAIKQSFDPTNTFYNDHNTFGEGLLREKIENIKKKLDNSSDLFVKDDNNLSIDPKIITTTNATDEERLFKSMTQSTPIAKWEGIVISIDTTNQTFKGELNDILKNDEGTIIAEFDFADVEESKRTLIKENSIFYWNIYDANTYQGLSRGTNYIYFRETLPIWKNYDFDKISSETKKIHKSIFGDD